MDVEFRTGWNINRISAIQLAAFKPAVIDTYLPVIERFVFGGIESINYVRFEINSYSVSKNLRIASLFKFSKADDVLRSAFHSR